MICSDYASEIINAELSIANKNVELVNYLQGYHRKGFCVYHYQTHPVFTENDGFLKKFRFIDYWLRFQFPPFDYVGLEDAYPSIPHQYMQDKHLSSRIYPQIANP